MDGTQGGSLWISLAYIVFFILVMYLLVFLPQKKRDKKTKAMLDALKVGDSVVTIGGISGKIVNIKDDEITIETGVERAKVNFKKWAIKEVITPEES